MIHRLSLSEISLIVRNSGYLISFPSIDAFASFTQLNIPINRMRETLCYFLVLNAEITEPIAATRAELAISCCKARVSS